MPTKAALFKARARLGPEPLKALLHQVAAPLADPRTRGAFYRGRRVVAVDGTCLDVADTPANAQAFGRPRSGRGERAGAFPQLRHVGVAECGTPALVDVAMGPCTTGEQTLAAQVVGMLQPGMVCLADRGFFSFALWNQARSTGADLVWRRRSNHVLDCDERLPDGSFLSRLDAISDRRRADGVVVRGCRLISHPPGPRTTDSW